MSTCPLTGKVSDGLLTCTNPHMPDDIFVCLACPAFDPIIHEMFPETKLVSVDERAVEDEIKKIEGEMESTTPVFRQGLVEDTIPCVEYERERLTRHVVLN